MTQVDHASAHLARRGWPRSSPCCCVGSGPSLHGQEGFKFKSGVELVNVNVTVTDRSGRFVSGLTQEDFVVYDDTREQEITHFSAERVPVSLGITLDTSGSMAGEKMESAKHALDRFLLELLAPDDDVFLIRFGASPDLVHDWTTEKQLVSRRLNRISPAGGTAMYDAVAEAVPMSQGGEHRKKAILIVSDGNDTNSRTSVGELKQMIRDTEVLVYAVGIDGQSETAFGRPRSTPPVARPPVGMPFPFPRGGGRGNPWPQGPTFPGSGGSGRGGGVEQRRRARKRQRAARAHRRQRRPHRDRALGARSRIRRRPTSPMS